MHRLMGRPGVRKAALTLAKQPVIGKAADKFSQR
jgi:hypothetical protein